MVERTTRLIGRLIIDPDNVEAGMLLVEKLKPALLSQSKAQMRYPSPVWDADDAVIEALSLYLRKYMSPEDTGSLARRKLSTILASVIVDGRRRWSAKKRGGGINHLELLGDEAEQRHCLDSVFNEAMELLMSFCRDDLDRQILANVVEIGRVGTATKLGISRSSVDRRLAVLHSALQEYEYQSRS